MVALVPVGIEREIVGCERALLGSRQVVHDAQLKRATWGGMSAGRMEREWNPIPTGPTILPRFCNFNKLQGRGFFFCREIARLTSISVFDIIIK
jgi:hypothetical protein